MPTLPQGENIMREESQDQDPDFPDYSPTPEEEAEAGFYFFIQDLNSYTQSGKWGPRIWNSVDAETRKIWTNYVMLEQTGQRLTGWKEK
jgi:hypothetical protein